MLPTQKSSIRLFRFGGIDVFLHWSWFVIALVEMNVRSNEYSSFVWNVLEYVTLFAIVLMHEFGHSLACRQVGGKADKIVLWPLGGVAYVAPPPRPGATLWSIAAGPLVNVVLAPILFLLLGLLQPMARPAPDWYLYLRAICYINVGLLVLNLLPIYPLDGGQILRSLLWFVCGRARSLMITSLVGFLGVAALITMAIMRESLWIGIVSVFILLNCWRGLKEARLLGRLAKLPRRAVFACPTCHQSPPIGPFWRCLKCLQPSDAFETHAICPHCVFTFATTACLDCGNSHPFSHWSCSTTESS